MRDYVIATATEAQRGGEAQAKKDALEGTVARYYEALGQHKPEAIKEQLREDIYGEGLGQYGRQYNLEALAQAGQLREADALKRRAIEAQSQRTSAPKSTTQGAFSELKAQKGTITQVANIAELLPVAGTGIIEGPLKAKVGKYLGRSDIDEMSSEDASAVLDAYLSGLLLDYTDSAIPGVPSNKDLEQAARALPNSQMRKETIKRLLSAIGSRAVANYEDAVVAYGDQPYLMEAYGGDKKQALIDRYNTAMTFKAPGGDGSPTPSSDLDADLRTEAVNRIMALPREEARKKLEDQKVQEQLTELGVNVRELRQKTAWAEGLESTF
jgi:hypothetical protein